MQGIKKGAMLSLEVGLEEGFDKDSVVRELFLIGIAKHAAQIGNPHFKLIMVSIAAYWFCWGSILRILVVVPQQPPGWSL